MAPAARTTLLFLALLLPGACRDSGRPGEPPRHLMLITVDTLRADHVSAYLYPRTTTWIHATPEQRASGAAVSIDALASEGVLFSNAFAPRGQTVPSLASLMTGRPPLEHGLLSNHGRLPEGEQTLAELLRAQGFVTGAFVANALLTEDSGLLQGFDHTFTTSRREVEDPDYAVIGEAWRWIQLERMDEGPPMFTWVHLMGPHLPYDPLPFQDIDFASLFADPGYDGVANGSREFLDDAYAQAIALAPLDIERVGAYYDGEIARTSYLVQMFLRLYNGIWDEEWPRLLDETALVFTADHGEELYQRNGYWAHSKSVYDSVLQVPLFLRHPKSVTGSRIFGDLVELQDILPTVCVWFGLDTPAGVRGRPLFSLIDELPQTPWQSRSVFGTWEDRIFTVRTPEWRYVWNPDGIEPDDPPAGAYPIPLHGLYAHAADPLELRNVADVDESHRDQVRALQAEIQRWLTGLDVANPELRSRTEALVGVLHDLGYASADEGSKDPGDVGGGGGTDGDDG